MESKFDAFEIVFAVVAVVKKDDNFVADRYLGCGFFLNEDGYFATCAHVVKAIKPGEGLGLMRANTNQVIFVQSVNSHSEFDFSILKVNYKPNHVLVFHENEVVTGNDVYAFGYYNSRRDGDDLKISFQIFKGYVSSEWYHEGTLDAEKAVFQLSFPVLNGFSGAPLFINQEVCGMLFVNRETSITVSHSKYEEVVEEENKKTLTVEKVQRIYEAGVAHQIKHVLSWVRGLGIKVNGK